MGRAIRVAWGVCVALISAVVGVALMAAAMAVIRPPEHDRTGVETENPTSRYDHYFGGVPIPLAHGRATANGQVFHFSYGRFGQRLSRSTDARQPSIVVLGCSLAWGYGVDGDKTFGALIEDRLGEEVLNLAVSGSSTIYQARRLATLPDDAKRTVRNIVYLLYEDHLYRNVRRCAPMDQPVCLQLRHVEFENGVPFEQAPAYSVEWLAGGPYETMKRWYIDQQVGGPRRSFGKDVLWSAYRFYAAADRIVHREPDWTAAASRPQVLAALDYSLGVMADEARRLDARLVVAWVPLYVSPERLKPMPADVAAVVAKHASESLDLSEPLNATLSADGVAGYPFAIPNDGHFSELGHRVVADQVVAKLRQSARRTGR